MRSALLVLLLLTLLPGCARTSIPAAGHQLTAARSAWQTGGPVSYRFDFDRHCFCIREAVEPVTVTVSDGVITEVRSRTSGERMGSVENVTWLTIDDLFGVIEEAQANPSLALVVEYHASGYPTRIEVGSLAADAGIHYVVSNLQPLP